MSLLFDSCSAHVGFGAFLLVISLDAGCRGGSNFPLQWENELNHTPHQIYQQEHQKHYSGCWYISCVLSWLLHSPICWIVFHRENGAISLEEIWHGGTRWLHYWKKSSKYHQISQISQISPPLQFIWNGIRCIYLLLLLFVMQKTWYDPVEHRLLLGHGALLSAREKLHQKFRLSTQRTMEFLPLLAGVPNLRLYLGWVWQPCGRPVVSWVVGRHCLTLQNTAVPSQEEAADIVCTGTAQCMRRP